MSDAKQPEPYKMPEIGVGDSVIWKTQPNAPDGHAALVVRVTPHAVTLLVFPAEGNLVTRKEAVRHISDPNFARAQPGHDGAWDYSALHKKIAELSAKLDAAL